MTSCSARRGRSHKHRSHKHRSHTVRTNKHRSRSLSPFSVPGARQQCPGGQGPPAAVWTLSSLSLPVATGWELDDLQGLLPTQTIL